MFETKGDATKSEAIPAAMERALEASPGARASSFWSTGSSAYVSKDKHTTFMELYPAGAANINTKSGAEKILAAAKTRLPSGVSVHVTGHDAIMEANQKGETGGPSLLVEALIGGLGALVILFFVFGTLPAVLLARSPVSGRPVLSVTTAGTEMSCVSMRTTSFSSISCPASFDGCRFACGVGVAAGETRRGR